MGHSEKIMVFDFGGGTLDITVFSYEKSADGRSWMAAGQQRAFLFWQFA